MDLRIKHWVSKGSSNGQAKTVAVGDALADRPTRPGTLEIAGDARKNR